MFDVREVRVSVLRVCVLRVCVVCERDKRIETGGRRGRVVALLSASDVRVRERHFHMDQIGVGVGVVGCCVRCVRV